MILIWILSISYNIIISITYTNSINYNDLDIDNSLLYVSDN